MKDKKQNKQPGNANFQASLNEDLATVQAETEAEMESRSGGMSNLAESNLLASQGQYGQAGIYMDKHAENQSMEFNYQGAAQSYEEAASLFADDVNINHNDNVADFKDIGRAYMSAGDNYMEVNEHGKALEAYQNALTNFDDVVNGFSDGSAGSYNDIADTYSKMGTIYLGTGLHSEAAQAFENAAGNYSNMVNISGDHSQTVFECIGDAYNNAGHAYWLAGNGSQSYAAFENAASNFMGAQMNGGAERALKNAQRVENGEAPEY